LLQSPQHVEAEGFAMQGLPVTHAVLPQAQAAMPDGAAACCDAPGADVFSKVLNAHISERFSAKAALLDTIPALQADIPTPAGDAGPQPGMPQTLDVSQLAELLAQMSTALQLKTPAQAAMGGEVQGTMGQGADVEVPGADPRTHHGKEPASLAADGRFLPVPDKAQALPAQAREAVPDFAQAMLAQGPEHSARGEALAMVQVRETPEIRHAQQPQVVEPRVGTPQWDGAVGQKVVWLIGQNQQSADLHLNPPHLGPLEVRLNMAADGQTSIQFVSQQPMVREALESAIPRLREMLAENGIALGNVQVGAESFARQEQGGEGQGHGSKGQGGGVQAEMAGLQGPAIERSGLGMLDLFA
jgi:flagellar hook-length control protein FliK